MNKELKDLLNFDSLDTAERMTGRSYKEHEDVVGLGFLLLQDNSRQKEVLLRAIDDSLFSNKLSDYTRIIAAEGFEKVLEIPFEVKESYDPAPRQEKFFVYWKACEGLFLCFDSFNGDSVNGGHIYFNLEAPEYISYDVPYSGGYMKRDDGHKILVGDIDCREAIRTRLNGIREQGKFLPVWEEQKFMWLLHYGDTRNEGYDYKKINQERITQLPENVQKAIRGAI